MEEQKQKKSKKDNKSAKSFKPEANIAINQFSTNTNVFSQLSAQFLQAKSSFQEDKQVTDFIQKNSKKREMSFAQYDPEMQKILNALNKKSEVTKQKALDQLQTYLKAQDQQFFTEFISTWSYMYKQFITSEHDRKILEEVNRVLLIIVEKNKKCIQKHFKEIFPCWFLCMNDIHNQEMSKVAEKAFQTCFPQDKHNQVLNFALQEIVKTIQIQLNQTASTIAKENINLNDFQSQEICDRLIISSLLSIQRAVKIVNNHKKTDLQNNQPLSQDNLVKEMTQIVFEAVDNKNKIILVHLLEDQKRFRVKAAVLDAFTEIFNCYTEEEVQNTLNQEVLQQFTRNIFNLMSDKERIVQISLWNGPILINLLQKINQKIFQKCDQKMIEYKSIEMIRSCAAGIGQKFYQNIIIFISLLPNASFIPKKQDTIKLEDLKEQQIREKLSYLQKLFDAFFASRESEEFKFFNNELIQSFYECIYFISLKRIYPLFKIEKFANLRKQLSQFLKTISISMVQDYINTNLEGKLMQNLLKQVPQCYSNLLNNLSKQDFLENEEGGSLAEQFIQPMIQEGIYEIMQKIFEKKLSTEDDKRKLKNLLILLDNIVKNLTSDTIAFAQLNQIFSKTHELLMSNISLSQFTDINNDILEKQIDFIEKYTGFSKILGEHQKQPLAKIVLEEQISKIFAIISENFQILCKNVKKIGSNYQKLETVTTYFIQILYSWSNDKEKVQPIFIEIFDFFKTQIFEKIDFNMPQAYPLIVMGFHFIQPNITKSYFYDLQLNTKNDKKKEEQSMNRQITLFEREHSKIQQKYQQFTSEFQQYQDFASFYIIKAFKQTKIQSKQVLPSIINILVSYLNKSKQQEVLSELKEISQNFKSELLEKANKNYYNIEKIEQTLVLANSFNKVLPKNENQYTNDYFKQVVQVIFYLYQNRMKAKSSNYFNALKTGMKDSSIVLEYFNSSIQSIITEQMDYIFIQQASQKGFNDRLDRFLLFILDVIEFLRQGRQQKEIENLILQILQQKYFENIIFNTKNWKLLKNIFQKAVIAIDLNKFLQKLFFQGDHHWLFTNMISSSSCQAIIDSIPLRKYFMEFSINFVKPIIYEGLENESQRKDVLQFITLMSDLCITNSLIYLNGLKVLVKQIIVENMNQDVIKSIFEDLIQNPIKNIFEKQDKFKDISDFIIKQGLIIKSLFYLFGETIDQELQISLIESLEDTLQTSIESKQILKAFVSLDLISNLQESQFLIQNQEFIMKFLIENIENIFISTQEDDLPKNFQMSVFFEFVNFAIEKLTIEVFKSQIDILERLLRQTIEYNAKPRKFSSLVMIRALQFIRKIIPIINNFSNDFKQFLVTQIIDTCLIKFNRHEQSEQEEQQQQNEIYKNESIDQEIIEFAETITRFSLIIDSTFDENITIDLMNCKYPAIQKACFVLLEQFYQSYIPDVAKIEIDQSDQNYQQLLLEQIINPDLNIESLIHFLDFSCLVTEEDIQQQKLQQQLQQQLQKEMEGAEYLEELEIEETQQKEIVEPKMYSYMMTWIVFIKKLNSKLENDNYEIVKRVLQVYLEEHKPLYQNFLTVLFNCINSLGFNEQDFKSIVKPEEVSKVSTEWSDFLCKESLFRLLIQALYAFCTRFPSYLRQWVDDTPDKKYIKIAQNLIRTFISQAIFTNEVETIEVSQHEWQTDEFQIHPYKNTREIIAVFEKESQRLQIKLQVPPEYPLQPIQTEIEKGVKINQLKINKWMLRMQSLLMNQNGNIKNILVTWKNNIDKEFEGIEECPICYYVIHSVSKELPKLSCKTCKYKFHSVCIKKWFASSNKSDCPMCKSQFL